MAGGLVDLVWDGNLKRQVLYSTIFRRTLIGEIRLKWLWLQDIYDYNFRRSSRSGGSRSKSSFRGESKWNKWKSFQSLKHRCRGHMRLPSTRILHTKPTSKHDNSETCWPKNRQNLYQTNIQKCVKQYRLQRYTKIWSICQIWANIYPIRSESIYTNVRPTSKSLSGCARRPLVTFGAAQHSKPNQRCRLSV